MNELRNNFNFHFQSLSDHPPYPWQWRLFERLAVGRFYDALDIPTGLGKTNTISAWLLACLMAKPATRPPLRLVYVVNRRTIVDQATKIAEGLWDRIRTNSAVKELWERRFKGEELAVSTLRGAKADNGGWLLAPHRPAIVIGTVDMIGSRLLFNAYRAGPWQRSRHAGLLGQDSLIVHDEAHLSQPFQELLEWVVARQQCDRSPRPLRLMSMSATGSGDGDTADVLRLADEDLALKAVQDRIAANKRLKLHPPEDDVPSQLARLAFAHESVPARVIVFVRTPEIAGKVVRQLKNTYRIHAARIELLTGTIRGYERDKLVEKPVLKDLLNGTKPAQTEYLVATSAGEVGADFDADHLVSDLSTIESMIQRFGRVNRRGGDGREALIDVVLNTPEQKKGKDGKLRELTPIDCARLASGKFLDHPTSEQGDDIDASPGTVCTWRDRLGYAQACEPKPPTRTPHDVVLDAWSATSIQEDWSLAHEVHPYLHGFDDPEPETFVAWRAELDEFSIPLDGQIDVHPFEQILLKYYPLRPRELLRDKPRNVAELLAAARSHFGEKLVVLIYKRQVTALRLSELSQDKNRLAEQVRYRTVILPASVGGLNEAGTIEPISEKPAIPITPVPDVADAEADALEPKRARAVLERDAEGEWSERQISPRPGTAASLGGKFTAWTKASDYFARRLSMRQLAKIVLSKDEECRPARLLLLFVERAMKETETTKPVTVDAHNKDVHETVERLLKGIGMFPEPAKALTEGARHHDLGKMWQCGAGKWQEAIGNKNPAESLAKSPGLSCNWRLLDGYRHEFGSLLRVIESGAFGSLEGPARDLALHLIATHHGRGRPHFELGAMQTAVDRLPEALAPSEVGRRFDRLQRKYGHWGLAWLESILMAADAEASQSRRMAPAEDENEDTQEE